MDPPLSPQEWLESLLTVGLSSNSEGGRGGVIGVTNRKLHKWVKSIKLYQPECCISEHLSFAHLALS